MVDSVPVSSIGDSGLGFTGCGEVSVACSLLPLDHHAVRSWETCRSQQFAEWMFSKEAFTG